MPIPPRTYEEILNCLCPICEADHKRKGIWFNSISRYNLASCKNAIISHGEKLQLFAVIYSY